MVVALHEEGGFEGFRREDVGFMGNRRWGVGVFFHFFLQVSSVTVQGAVLFGSIEQC